MAAEVEDVPASEQTAQTEGKSSIYLGSYLILPLHYSRSPYSVSLLYIYTFLQLQAMVAHRAI